MSSSNIDSFSSSFPVGILFLFCLIAVARASNTVLLILFFNKRGKSEHPCLVPDLRGNAFSFSLLSIILVMVLSYLAFIVLCSFCAHFV